MALPRALWPLPSPSLGSEGEGHLWVWSPAKGLACVSLAWTGAALREEGRRLKTCRDPILKICTGMYPREEAEPHSGWGGGAGAGTRGL